MYSSDKLISSSAVIQRIKTDLQNPANKIEGSLGSDNAQAVGKEIAKYYSHVNWLQDMHYVETAQGIYLDRKAIEAGVIRKEPTKAYGKVKFIGSKGTTIPYGFIVRSDTQEYKTLEAGTIVENFIILDVEAINAGIQGNVPEGAITKFEPLDGLKEVINLEATYNGTDLEEDEPFRERTLLRMRYPGTSGNKYHYMHWAMEVEGVGRVKVFPLWEGPGTVKVSILDSNQKVAKVELRQKVKDHIDIDSGMGDALAPIGATLTVTTATEKVLNIDAKIQLVDIPGYTISGIKEAFQIFLQEHFEEISYQLNRLTIAKVIDILWNIEGVADITELKINGESDNIIFEDEEIPTLGVVSVE